MYCRNCGKQMPDDANFCASCGASQNDEINREFSGQVTFNNGEYSQSNRVLEHIGQALIIIGIIFGITTVSFIGSEGAIFDFSSWDYEYGDGKTVIMILSILTVISLIIGISIKSATKSRFK